MLCLQRKGFQGVTHIPLFHPPAAWPPNSCHQLKEYLGQCISCNKIIPPPSPAVPADIVTFGHRAAAKMALLVSPLSSRPLLRFPSSHPKISLPALGPLVTSGCPSSVALRSRIRIVIHSWRALALRKRCDPFPVKRERNMGPIPCKAMSSLPWREPTGDSQLCFTGTPTRIHDLQKGPLSKGGISTLIHFIS